MESSSSPVLYTIGHSNHAEEKFLDLLQQHEIEVLADVRSQPFSRYSPHFNGGSLEATLTAAGVKYLFLGNQLGGRPEDTEFLDDDGHVLYHRVAEAPFFLEGLTRLEKGMRRYRVAIMCSEEDPAVCHRHLLVTRVIDERGVPVFHIRGDGRLQSEAEIRPQEKQAVLFQDMEQDTWRSIRSVLPKHPPPNSSES